MKDCLILWGQKDIRLGKCSKMATSSLWLIVVRVRNRPRRVVSFCWGQREVRLGKCTRRTKSFCGAEGGKVVKCTRTKVRVIRRGGREVLLIRCEHAEHNPFTHTPPLVCICVSDPRDKPPSTGNVLSAGAHEYPFQYVLPRSLPSSFESQDVQFKGRVHYLLRAKQDTPDESVRTNSDKIFLVLSSLDLNKEQKVAVRTHQRMRKSVYMVPHTQLALRSTTSVNMFSGNLTIA